MDYRLLGAAAKDGRIVCCRLYDLGAGGIRLGEPKMPESDAAETSRTLVDNNYIHDYGEVYPAGVGVFLMQTSDNRVSHNEIHDGNYTGVSVGWNWGRAPYASR
ncbi:MAG: right-handed parallel beta-helix repeat-containing protein [Armatimonadetes bacterium]|nr:right-handed parallel beta-helix repeat-containing protein [Armatimonadota bacterium]